jgi:hypothetical protein
MVLPQKSGFNGPLITLFLFPKSKLKWVERQKDYGQCVPAPS